MSVPSNLIPVAITGLPQDPAPSDQGFLAYSRAGTTYKVQVADILSYSGVPTTRQVLAGTGLTGGGQLTSNVTLSVAAGGIGPTQLANTGVAAGTYGDASNAVTVGVDAQGRITSITTSPIVISGYVPVTRQVIAGVGLTGGGALSGNITLSAAFSASTPQPVDTTGSAGVANEISRSDHKHPAIDLADDDQVDGLLGMDNGGTGRSLVPVAGSIVYSGADGLYIGTAGNAGQVLVSAGASGYSWGTAVLVSDQAANLIFAGPAAGPNAPVTFRSMVNADLPNSGVAANTYGSATAIPVIVVNSKGVITGVTTQNVVGGVSSVNGQTGVVVLTASDVGAPATNGTGASGTWGISISGTAATATNVAGGAANRIVYNTGANTSAFITAPTVANTYLEWSGSAFQWSANPLGSVTSVDVSGGTTGLTTSGGPIITSGTITLAGTLAVANGGTGATTLTGYVKGTGTSALTASSTIPNTDITGLGTMSTQNANSVAVTGGSINGTTVGATTPSSGAFTSVTGTVDATFNGVTVGKGAGSISNNTVVGVTALNHNTTGQQNTAMGISALTTATTANNQTAIGYQALRLSNAADNTAVGSAVLQATTSGAGNVAVGFQTLTANTTGSNNTAIGKHALITNSTGSNITALGNHAGAYETGSNALYIDAIDRVNTAGDKAGALLYGTFNATPSSQTLAINAAVTLPYTLNVTGVATLAGGISGGTF